MIADAVDSPELADFDKTRESLRKNVANSEKTRHIEISSVVFLQLLHDIGGTFVWSDGPNRGDKFSTIFEALATQLPEYGDLGTMQKGDFISENASCLKTGFRAAREWLSHWHGRTIYLVPQYNESAKPTVLTIVGSYKLENGKTAAEMQTLRERKMVRGQVRSSAYRMISANGGDKDAAMNIIAEELNAISDLIDTTRQLTAD